MVVLIVGILSIIILLLYVIVVAKAVAGWKSTAENACIDACADNYKLASLVIPIHNGRVPSCLPSQIPIVLVDDYSDEPIECSQANVVVIKNTYRQGKKWALRCGIEFVQTPYVITSDCDVYMSDLWVNAVVNRLAQTQPDLLILPLSMRQHTLLGALQETEYVAIQTLTLGYALSDCAIMCSGANLAVRRDCWLASWSDIKPEIASGDDMFILHSFKRQKLHIDCLKCQSAIVTIDAAPDLKSLLHQRARWAGKSVYYSDRATNFVGAVVLATNLLMIVCPPLIVLKWIIDFCLVSSSVSFFNLKGVWWKSILLSVVYPIYVLITILMSIFRNKKW